jgi:hypothetical protein
MVRYEKSNDSKIHSYYPHLPAPVGGQRHCQCIALNISCLSSMVPYVPEISFGHTKQNCWFCPVIYSVAQSLVGILANHNQTCAQPQNDVARCVVYVHTNDATVMSLSRLTTKKEGQTLLPQRKLLLRYLGPASRASRSQCKRRRRSAVPHANLCEYNGLRAEDGR